MLDSEKSSKQIEKSESIDSMLNKTSYELKLDVSVIKYVHLKFTNIPQYINFYSERDIQKNKKWYTISFS